MRSAILKEKTISIALILVLAMSSALAVVPIARAIGTPWPYSYTPTIGSNGLWNLPTFAGLTVSPDPVGVGQPVQVIMIIELLPPSSGHEGTTLVSGGWLGFMLTITDPNGTKTTMGPYESDVSGTYQISYTPTMVGTYTFQFSFPGQTVNGTGFGNYYGNFLPSTSDAVPLTVQSTPVTGYSEAPVPLPDQYWTTPINAQNRYWSTISGPWLRSTSSGYGTGGYNATGEFNPYTYAPRSAHILWAKTLVPNGAGIAGGTYGSQQFGTQFFNNIGMANPIIMGGYLYYDSAPEVLGGSAQGNPALTNQPVSTFSCMNMQTGQIMWTVPGTITNGQILEWRTQQEKDTLPYLWAVPSSFGPGAYAGPWQMYDAVTGALLAQWDNIPAGHAVAEAYNIPMIFGPAIPIPATTPTDVSPMGGTFVNEEPHPTVVGQNIGGAEGGGALLVYIIGSTPGSPTAWLACWNSTLAINSYNNNPQMWNLDPLSPEFPSMEQQQITPLDWNFGIMWNLTFPNPTYMSWNFMMGSMPALWSILGADGDYVILTSSASNPAYTGTESFLMAGVDVANQPMTTTYTLDMGGDTQVPTAGTFAWETNITVPAYDLTPGGGPSVGLQNGGIIVLADSTTQSVTAYSEYTGDLLWSCNPWNNDFSMQSVGNVGPVAYGLLYNAGYDGYMHAINITNGVQMWQSITKPGGLEIPEPAYPCMGCVVADNEVFTSTGKGYEAMPLYRGHCLYAYDALTGAQNWNISGEFWGMEIADGILIGQDAYDGRVYAFAPGLTATTVTAPMNAVTVGSSCVIEGTVTDQTSGTLQGTPAISDQWMTPWMEYMFMDQPYPSGATGVPVSIDAVDPNNNFVHIGNATSDITGAFIYQWTPPNVPGKYTIIATFAGSNSYYASSGETGAVVTEAVAATPPPTYPVPYDYTMTIIAATVVLLVAIAIVGILLLRKRP
jgi:hypothetical protein